jgi:hypothetical protein
LVCAHGDIIERGEIIGPEHCLDHRGVSRRESLTVSDLRFDVRRALPGLPKNLLDICNRLMHHETIIGIARELGVPRHAVYQQIEAIRRHFATQGLRTYRLPCRQPTKCRRNNEI